MDSLESELLAQLTANNLTLNDQDKGLFHRKSSSLKKSLKPVRNKEKGFIWKNTYENYCMLTFFIKK